MVNIRDLIDHAKCYETVRAAALARRARLPALLVRLGGKSLLGALIGLLVASPGIRHEPRRINLKRPIRLAFALWRCKWMLGSPRRDDGYPR